MTHRTRSFRVLPVALAALLTACGGTGGDRAADANAVAADLAALTLTFANGDSAGHVTLGFSVPIAGGSGSAFRWSSSIPVIAVDAAGQVTVTRPPFDGADAPAILTATATKGGASATRAFPVTVIRFGQSAAEKAAALAMDKAAIAPSLAAGDTLAAVRHDFTVPVTGASGSTVTWASSDASITIDAQGKATVTRPGSGPDLAVTLTATLSNAVATDTKTFVLTVKEGSSATRVAEDVAWVLDNRVKLFGNDPYQENSPAGLLTYYPVHADFTVPLVGPSGSALTWDASTSNGRIVAIDAQGRVSLLHHPGFGTTLQDRGFLVFTASHGGIASAAQYSSLVFSYHLTDPREAVAWDRIVAGYAIQTAAQFPAPVTTTNYPFSLDYPPATPPATRTTSHTTNRSFSLRRDLPTRSGTTATWKSSDESVILINNLTGAAAVMPRATQQVVLLTAVFTKDGLSAESPYYLEITVPPAPAAPLVPPVVALPPRPLMPPVPATPPEPEAPPALGSAGGVPGLPVALSLVRERMAIPFTKLTFLGLWVDRLNGDAQSATAQPEGTPEAWNSSRHSSLKLPLL